MLIALEENPVEAKYLDSFLPIKDVKAGKDGFFIEGYASTFQKDRDDEIIDPHAFDETMQEYMKNPIVLLGHDNDPNNCIGSVIEYRIDTIGLWVKIKLVDPISDMAKQIVQNIKDGVLKALSIGGMFEKIGNIIKRVNLMEISVVTVPANPEALFSVAKAYKSFMFEVEKQNKKQEEFDMEKEVLEKLMTGLKGIEDRIGKLETSAKDEEKQEGKSCGDTQAEHIKSLIEEVKQKAIDEAKAEIRQKQKIEFPTTNRSGNLSIQDKQLVDLIMKKEQTITLVNDEVAPFRFKGGIVPGVKGVAMDTAETGAGAEFIPTELANQLIDMVRVDAKTYALFPEWKMPTPTFDIPIQTSDPTWYLQGEATDDSTAKATSSTAGTGKMTLTAKKLGAKVPYSTDLDEDSAIAMLPFLKSSLAMSGAGTLDDMVINGDTTNPHQDNDVTAASDARKGWKGLRKLALSVAALTVDLSTFNADNLLSLGVKMNNYAADISKLAWIVSSKTLWGKLFTLRDAQNNNVFLSVDKFGTDAANVKGALGMMFGIPVIVSDKVRTDVNASGVYDGTTTTKATIILVRTNYFYTGSRRVLTFRTDFDGNLDSNILYVTMRNAFQPVQTPSATVSSVALGYNF